MRLKHIVEVSKKYRNLDVPTTELIDYMVENARHGVFVRSKVDAYSNESIQGAIDFFITLPFKASTETQKDVAAINKFLFRQLDIRKGRKGVVLFVVMLVCLFLLLLAFALETIIYWHTVRVMDHHNYTVAFNAAEGALDVGTAAMLGLSAEGANIFELAQIEIAEQRKLIEPHKTLAYSAKAQYRAGHLWLESRGAYPIESPRVQTVQLKLRFYRNEDTSFYPSDWEEVSGEH